MRWSNSLRLARAVSAGVSALALAACATVGPNFKSPAVAPAGGYAMAADPAPGIAALTPDARLAGPWWQSLGSPQLNAVMTEALAGNQTVAVAVATLEKAGEQERAARGELAPKLDANAGAERERLDFAAFGFPNLPNPTFNLFSVGGVVSYDLDLFGGGRRRVEAAAAMAQAQARRADAAYLSLTGNVALQAVRMAGLRARIDALHQIAADDQRNIEIVRRAEAAGGEAPSAGASGSAQLAEDQALVPLLGRELAMARHALAALVGRSPADWTAPDFAFAAFSPPDRIPVSLPSTLVRARPDILAAEADFHADTARIGVATADLYPDIRLSAGLSQGALTPASLFSYDSTGWNLGAGLTAPILNGGSLRAQRRAAEAQARVSLARYRLAVLTAFSQVADVLAALARDDERLAAEERAEAVATGSLRDSRNAYALGGSAFLQVIEAQRRLDRARLALVEARGQKLSDIVELYAVTATDWRDPPRAR